MQKRWNILHGGEAKIRELQDALKISPVICRLLVNRGIETFEQARNYFRPTLAGLHDPWLMKDMEKAVARIASAFTQRQKILVFGDYDVDGTTSVACLFQFLQKNYFSELIDFYIPHRYREGYGISKMGIDFAKEEGFQLVISVDCGIKSVELITYARELGIEFIVCDHHLPDKSLPPATAILNPKQADCPYPYKELCGCGVSFKLIAALTRKLGLPDEDAYVYLDLVATAIAADIVPVTGENRIIAYHGLKKINENPNYGIQALMELSGLQKEWQLENLIFMIAPRVNAAGRMDDAKKAVQMFISKTPEEALAFGKMLHADNLDRKTADSMITEEAMGIIEKEESLNKHSATVVFQPHWHKGVVGIVASRLIESYYRPTVVLTQSGEMIAGSARSVSGFNLYEAIHACREHLLGYGGHFAAAGLSLLPEKLASFRAKFEEVVSATIDPHLLIPEISIDAEVRFSEISPSLYKILKQMEPFGPENRRPVFIARDLTDSGYSKIIKQQHIRFSLRQGNILFTGIGFNMVSKISLVESKRPLDVVFTLDENHWNDQSSLQLKVIDINLYKP